MRGTCSSSNPQSTIEYTEDDLKILSRILSIKPQLYLPYFNLVMCPYMPALRLTQSQCPHEQNVEIIGRLLLDLRDQRSILLFGLVSQKAILKNIGYKVHQYLSTGLLLFERFSEDHLFPGEGLCILKDIIFIAGELLIGQLLKKVKRLSLRMRRGNKEFLG